MMILWIVRGELPHPERRGLLVVLDKFTTLWYKVDCRLKSIGDHLGASDGIVPECCNWSRRMIKIRGCDIT